jgi:glycyl-tRNA synthetase
VFHEISAEERAFYSQRTVDIEYAYPFGVKELYGIANRTDYDLSRHSEFSKEDLRWLDPETNEKVLPYVVEPTWGLTRSVLAVLCEHLDIDEADTADGADKEPRMVLRLPPRLAPVKAAVFPLQKKDEMATLAKELVAALRAKGIVTEYDESASIGKRYRRQDEIGTPWCFTVDFDSVNDKTVTVRDRDAMTQERLAIADVPAWVAARL